MQRLLCSGVAARALESVSEACLWVQASHRVARNKGDKGAEKKGSGCRLGAPLALQASASEAISAPIARSRVPVPESRRESGSLAAGGGGGGGGGRCAAQARGGGSRREAWCGKSCGDGSSATSAQEVVGRSLVADRRCSRVCAAAAVLVCAVCTGNTPRSPAAAARLLPLAVVVAVAAVARSRAPCVACVR